MSKILIVDDNAFIRGSLKKILSDNGYDDFEEAENGVQAIKKYKTTHPDLVFMDITMPVMDGISALKEIKTAYPSAQIIMCSSVGEQAKVIESIQNGARDFITKPLTRDRIVEAVKKLKV